jgi:predicted house-cleaning noncanonical NTP pyrophosphatase (MazG superfamily)
VKRAESVTRKQVADLVTKYLDGHINYREFLDKLPEEVESTADEQVYELLDLLEHEPAVGRVLGLSKQEHLLYRERIRGLVNQLRE